MVQFEGLNLKYAPFAKRDTGVRSHLPFPSGTHPLSPDWLWSHGVTGLMPCFGVWVVVQFRGLNYQYAQSSQRDTRVDSHGGIAEIGVES